MATSMMAQKSALGSSFQGLRAAKASRKTIKPVASGGGKVDIKKQGLESVENEVVKQNLMGRSRYMNKKGWIDSQGRKGKGLGVYRFQDKYGANVDGYSPIYTPDQWTSAGGSYKLGAKGIAAWLALVVTFLGVGITLIINTSQLGV